MTPAQVEVARRLQRDECSIREISIALKVPRATVARALERHDAPMPARDARAIARAERELSRKGGAKRAGVARKKKAGTKRLAHGVR